MTYAASLQPYALGATEVEPLTNKYVIYMQVCTAETGRRGQGLDPQQRDISFFLDNYLSVPHAVIGKFTDVVRCSRDDVPELVKAIELAKKTGAELLVAKLDVFSHRTAIIEDPGLSLRVAQLPFAEKQQLQVYAALLEQEQDFHAKKASAMACAAKVRLQELHDRRARAAEEAAELEHQKHKEQQDAASQGAMVKARARAKLLAGLSQSLGVAG